MSPTRILKAQDFSEVAEVRADDKKRITLRRVKKTGKIYKIYVNSIGQIILDPQVTIPASELWLYENKAALSAVRKGLKESAEGKLIKKPSLAKYSDDSLE